MIKRYLRHELSSYAVHGITALILLLATGTSRSAPVSALPLGLYAGQQFVVHNLPCQDCTGLPQALWYFRQQQVALPAAGQVVVRYDPALSGTEDVQDLQMNALPGLIWTGASQQWQHATLSASGAQVSVPAEGDFTFKLVPKLATNHAYWNAATLTYLADTPLTVRGELAGNTLIARSIWPEHFRLQLDATTQALTAHESLQTLVQFENGGARSPYQSRLLWEKSPGAAAQSAGKAALGVILNGAQGDDDEAHGGHFALATGVVSEDGGYANWLVNNYYNLAANSEKGIIAAITPLDKYMGDLNSGQSFYRPSYMLVAVFDTPEIPQHIQAASNRVYQHFYRNDLVYDHARNNCAGISVDTLRQLGWQVPTRGVENMFKASAAYWYVAITERSLKKGRAIYDYLNSEMTRLYPAVAFDAIGSDLLTLAQTGNTQTLQGVHMQTMPKHLQAIYFVRIPQLPSSRAFGLAPVYSFAQYLQQAPADRAQWKIIPVTPNPLPEHLKDGLARQPLQPALLPISALALLIVLGMVLLLVLRGIRCFLMR